MNIHYLDDSTQKLLFMEIHDQILFQSIETKLTEIYDLDLATDMSRIIEKLNNLYKGPVNIPTNDNYQYINLSHHELSDDQIAILP